VADNNKADNNKDDRNRPLTEEQEKMYFEYFKHLTTPQGWGHLR
jgi:hypothetical protein